MSTHTNEKLPPIKELSPEEAWELFDRQAQAWLGISGEEFIRRYDAGEISADDLDYDNDVIALYIMMPRKHEDEDTESLDCPSSR